MAKDHSTDKNRPIKTLKETQASSPPCQDCGIITKTMDTTALAQSGFSDLGALCQAIRCACDKHTNPVISQSKVVEKGVFQPDTHRRKPEAMRRAL